MLLSNLSDYIGIALNSCLALQAEVKLSYKQSKFDPSLVLFILIHTFSTQLAF